MLVEVDNRPIRRSYTARLRRARRAVTRLEKQIARYDHVDTPAFYLWYHCEFGHILAHHRGLREQIAAHEFMQRDPNTENTAENSGRRQTPVAEDSAEARQSTQDYSEPATELDESFSLEPKEPRRECQRLFRQIALRLHPDRGGPLLGERKLWWLQAQSAYESGDLVTLQLVLSRCTPPRRTIFISCGEILELIEETRKRAEALINLRTRLRREPAWRFTAKSEQTRASLRARLARELARIERALVDRLRQLAPAPDVWIQECETV